MSIQRAPPPISSPQNPHLHAQTHHERIPLPHTLLIESLSAFTSSLLVAPIITIIDRSIFLAASSTTTTLPAALRAGTRDLLTHPVRFYRQPATLFMFAVYAGTYWTANTIQSVCDYEGWDWFYPKFVGTTVANVGLCVAKDVCFTRWFGTGTPKPVPLRSYALYTSRDMLTVFASFNLPPILAAKLSSHYAIPKRQAEVASQLLTPCAVQLVSTPMHLLGMDVYNRPTATSRERWGVIGKQYWSATAARVGRIFAAFGIGGVANQYFRFEGKEWLRRYHGL
ncbi:hypothetical protein PhCBS80983_g03274 [Powellomyces hirtus]|uniref:Uncharacterized protein n=1 Tax=Powellomyces hirtus TaxID=109895 RepID=A0A507E587_9FUNG|nr:hypothetical protein PhCBS80983_g03274 [Powellomyces hirtus]